MKKFFYFLLLAIAVQGAAAQQNTSFSLIDLLYPTNGLEPVISQTTIELHHGKHLQGYVNNVNKLVKDTSWEGKTIEDIVRGSEGSLYDNAGQMLNHNLYFTGRADQLAGSAALQVAGQSDRSVQAEASGIGGGKLYLGLGAEWAKDADIWLALLRANDGDLLVAGKLAFDGQFFFNGQLCVWAKQGGKILSSQVYVSCGSFYWKCVAHIDILLKQSNQTEHSLENPVLFLIL